MKTLCKHILVYGFMVLTVLALPQWWGTAVAKEGKSTFSKADMARMSTFLSNFTELKLMNFTAAEVLNPEHTENAVHFGIWHNYINNFRTRVETCDPGKYGSGCLAIEAKYVLESIEKYFGKNDRFVKGLQANQPKEFDGKFYHFPGADGEPPYHANVLSAETNPDGTITMRGEIFNADLDYKNLGAFEAVARPQVYKGKATWYIVSLSVPGWY